MKAVDHTDRLDALRSFIFFGSILMYVIVDIIGIHSLKPVLSICAVAAILIALPKLGKIGVSLSALFLCIGLVILWKHHIPFTSYLTFFGGMFNLLALFSIIPIISIPIKIGGYGAVIQRLLERRIKSPFQLYRTISLYSFFLSCFMNLATLPMMYFSVKNTVESFPIRQVKRYTSNAIIHGYALPILWTPVAPIVGVVVDVTHLNWVTMFPYLIILSLLGLFLDWIIYYLIRSRYELSTINISEKRTNQEMAASLETSELPKSKSELGQMAVAVSLFILLIVGFQYLFSIGLMSVVTILTIPFAFIWSSLLNKQTAFFGETLKHIRVQLPKMSDQYAIFLSAGFLVSVIQTTGSNTVINNYVSSLAHTMGPHNFMIILPLIPLILAFFGMHPALAISLLTGSLNTATLGIRSDQLALALLGGAVSTFMLGPFNATSGVMASIVKVSTFQVVRWNVGYTLAFIGFIMVILFFS